MTQVKPQPISITSPEGRIVMGHPFRSKLDLDKAGNPKIAKDGISKVMSTFFALAIPKAGATDWKKTEWGQLINGKAAADWPNGEYMNPSFSWKIEDGDSVIPNTNQKKNCDREGFPGNWIIKCSTTIGSKAYTRDTNNNYQDLIDPDLVKCGDYGHVSLEVKGNGPDSQSPGVYVSPKMFLRTRIGEAIVGGTEADPTAAFGNVGNAAAPAAMGNAAAPAAMGNAAAPAAMGMQAPATVAAATAPAPVAYAATTAPAVAPSVGSAPAPVAAPAPDFLNVPAPTPVPVEKSYIVDGNAHTESSLRNAGYTDAHFAALQQA